jgi:hypothetical protein
MLRERDSLGNSDVEGEDMELKRIKRKQCVPVGMD